VGRREQWRKNLEGFKMNESPVAREWRAEARRQGEIKGKLEGKAEMLLLVLKGRFAPLPEDLVARVRATADSDQLDRWAEAAVTATTLEDFRRDAGL
jgi:hypothetical protein